MACAHLRLCLSYCSMAAPTLFQADSPVSMFSLCSAVPHHNHNRAGNPGETLFHHYLLRKKAQANSACSVVGHHSLHPICLDLGTTAPAARFFPKHNCYTDLSVQCPFLARDGLLLDQRGGETTPPHLELSGRRTVLRRFPYTCGAGTSKRVKIYLLAAGRALAGRLVLIGLPLG